jgi:hypothetical protein
MISQGEQGSSSPPLFFGLNVVSETIKARGPEAFVPSHPIPRYMQRRRIEAYRHDPSGLLASDEASFGKHSQMFHDSGKPSLEWLRQPRDRCRTLSLEPAQNGKTGGIAHCSERLAKLSGLIVHYLVKYAAHEATSTHLIFRRGELTGETAVMST